MRIANANLSQFFFYLFSSHGAVKRGYWADYYSYEIMLIVILNNSTAFLNKFENRNFFEETPQLTTVLYDKDHEHLLLISIIYGNMSYNKETV